MLFAFTGSKDTPVWCLETAAGDYVLLPTARRPGGPVVFTSPDAARRFLRYHAARWRPLEAPRVRRLPTSLAVLVRRLRHSRSDRAVHLFIDPREPFAEVHAVDAEFLLIEPQDL